MKKFLTYLCLLSLIGNIGEVQAQKVLSEEELKKIDPKQVEKEKLERKHGELPEEKKVKIEEPLEVKEKKKEEMIIKKYRPKILYMPITLSEGNNLALKEQKGQTKQEEKSIKEKETTSVFQGQNFITYCYSPYSYQINIYPVLGELKCLIDGEIYKMRGNFIPDVRNFTLGFQVKEFNYCKGKVELSLMLKMKDSSPNLASHIDRKIIENVLAKSGSELGKETAKIITDYMKPEKRVIISEGVVITEEEQKDLKDELKEKVPYLAGAILTKNISDELLSFYGGRIPPIFYINKDETYYVEGSCLPPTSSSEKITK